MSNKINMIGIIDGDVLIYRACHKALKDKLNVKTAFDEIYQGVKDEIQCDEYSLHVSGKGNFRKKLNQSLTTYKGKRKEKPENFVECKEYVIKKYKPISKDGYEADDTASVEATEYLNKGQPYILITIDKDWQMIGGLFYSMMHKYVKPISKFDACEFLNTQLLTGDSVDNIPGLKGIGIVKATKLLKGKDLTRQFESVIRMYKKFHPEDYLTRLEIMGKMLFLIKDYKDNSNWTVDYWKGFISNV
jgi:5'-3' exonuclease